MKQFWNVIPVDKIPGADTQTSAYNLFVQQLKKLKQNGEALVVKVSDAPFSNSVIYLWKKQLGVNAFVKKGKYYFYRDSSKKQTTSTRNNSGSRRKIIQWTEAEKQKVISTWPRYFNGQITKQQLSDEFQGRSEHAIWYAYWTLTKKKGVHPSVRVSTRKKVLWTEEERQKVYQLWPKFDSGELSRKMLMAEFPGRTFNATYYQYYNAFNPKGRLFGTVQKVQELALV